MEAIRSFARMSSDLMMATEYDNIVDWYIEYHDLVRWEDGLNA